MCTRTKRSCCYWRYDKKNVKIIHRCWIFLFICKWNHIESMHQILVLTKTRRKKNVYGTHTDQTPPSSNETKHTCTDSKNVILHFYHWFILCYPLWAIQQTTQSEEKKTRSRFIHSFTKQSLLFLFFFSSLFLWYKSPKINYFLSQFDLISANSLLDSHLNTWLQRFTLSPHTNNLCSVFEKCAMWKYRKFHLNAHLNFHLCWISKK